MAPWRAAAHSVGVRSSAALPVKDNRGRMLAVIERYLSGYDTIVDLACGSGLYGKALRDTGASIIGLIAGVVCCFAVGLKTRFGFDDALDVVGVHFVGGLVGSLLIGLFSSPDFFGTEVKAGLFEGGGLSLLGEQALANGATIVYSFVVTYLIALAIKATIGLRVDEETEVTGLDLAEHAETAYHGTN